MQKTIGIWLITMIMISFPLLTAARHDHQATGISIWLPDHWKMKTIGQAYYAVSPDGNAVAKYIQLNTRDRRHAHEIYQNYMDPQVRNFHVVDKVETFERHHLQFELIQAEARDERPMRGQQSMWKIKIYLITTPRQMGMLVLRHREGSPSQKIPFNNILESIKPL